MVGTEAAIKRTRLLRQLHAVVYLPPSSPVAAPLFFYFHTSAAGKYCGKAATKFHLSRR